MAYSGDLVRTKNWGTEILTDADLEGQLDLIINWVMAAVDSASGHKHDATANEGPKLLVGGIADDAVETAKIKALNVTAAKLAADAVETAKVKDANVTAVKLASDAVETAKIKDANVTYAKLAAAVKERVIKAWIQFNGSGVIAIADSYNVTSITDNGVGDYTITWDTNFANDDYAVVGMIRATNDGNGCGVFEKNTGADHSVGSVRVLTQNFGTSVIDPVVVNLIAIGDQ